jgi:KaiC/GvpD/RAD55 family RecA-like ATPase
MTQNGLDHTDSSEKLDALLKKLAMLENMVLMGNKVYTKESKEQTGSTLLQAKATIEKTELVAGETFALEIEIANFGRAPATLDGIEEILPSVGMELTVIPNTCQLEGSYLDLNGKVLESSKREKLRFTLRALEKGTHVIAPRIAYKDAMGAQRILNLKSTTISVKEIALAGRVSTGYKDLDNLLLGGMPEKYTVALTSISCDETKLLVSRFLEKGAREGGTTIMITVEPGRWEKLAEEFPNFHLFICNPQAEIGAKTLPNIVRLGGVENLTDINIPLVSALHRIEAPNDKPRRICIDILSDVLLQHQAAQTRRWLVGLTAELKSRGFTTLATINPYMYPAQEVQAILDMFDGEIVVYEKEEGKFLRIRKMYEQSYLENELQLRKDRLSMTGVTRSMKYQHY